MRLKYFHKLLNMRKVCIFNINISYVCICLKPRKNIVNELQLVGLVYKLCSQELVFGIADIASCSSVPRMSPMLIQPEPQLAFC